FGLEVRHGTFVGNELSGQLGNGGASIRLNSVNGQINIQHASDGKTVSPATSLLVKRNDGIGPAKVKLIHPPSERLQKARHDVAQAKMDWQKAQRDANAGNRQAARALAQAQRNVEQAKNDLQQIQNNPDRQAQDEAARAINEAQKKLSEAQADVQRLQSAI